MKRQISLTIDENTYLKIAQRRITDPDFNASEIADKAFGSYFDNEGLENKSIIEIEQELKEVNSTLKEIQNRKSSLEIKKLELKKGQKKKQEAKTKKTKAIIKGVKAAGILEEAFK